MDPWNFRDRPDMASEGKTVVGFSVRAVDGDIGKIDDATMDVDASHIVVDTGPCRTKDQIKESPELEMAWETNPTYRDRIGDYYGGTYGGI